MAYTSFGLNYLLEAYYTAGTANNLELRAYNASNTLLDSASVQYNAPSGGSTNISAASISLTIPAGQTVTSVELYRTDSGAVRLAYETISASFPSGGNLLVTSYELSVS